MFPIKSRELKGTTTRILFWAIAALIPLVTTILLGCWTIYDSRQQVIDAGIQSSENLATALAQDIARNIELYDLSLHAAVEGLQLPDIWSVSENIRQHVLFDNAASAPHLGAMAVTDQSGKIVASSVADPSGTVDYSDREYFVRHKLSPNLGLLITGPLKSRLTGQWALAISRRIDREDGSFAGVVVGTLQLSFFKQLFDGLRLGSKGGVSLLLADGRLIARKPLNEAEIGMNLGSSELFEHIKNAPAGHYEGPSVVDGDTYLFAYRQIADYPLYINVRTSKSAILAEWRRKSILIASVVLGLTALSLALCGALLAEFRRRGEAERIARTSERELASKSASLEEALAGMAAARHEAEAANTAKSNFLANMSHELRTPLNGIMGFSEVIRDAHLGNAGSRYREYAADIHAAGEHLLSLINDVLDISKIEVDRLELVNEELNLADVLDSCVHIVSETARSAAVSIKQVYATGLRIEADERRLKQIILNLLSNAVKFTPAGGCVQLSCCLLASGEVSIAVADTGIGMNPEDVPLALEPFRQVESRTRRAEDGTGLGLPLAQRLVNLHGGTLSIDTTLGAGTTVTITFPRFRTGRRLVPDRERGAA
ncbi:MAG: hypothetical protein JO038_06375 [Alphaproteobacteria bacterium]|nr:hypothetical protein [Alphaproteobacteria bacterium]